MRYLILGDIHANWEALEAVLNDAAGGYDRVLCTGDFVGYGADPARVVGWARSSGIVAVRGNHDRACCGLEETEHFNDNARAAVLWTREVLSREDREYLLWLPRGPLVVADFQILHGSPLDEDEYVITAYDLRGIVSYFELPLTFSGHTHMQGGFLWYGNLIREIRQVPAGTAAREVEIPADYGCLVNPGSVGQPRDGDPRAAYALYSPEEKDVIFRRVAYDVENAQKKILAAGLPARLAQRLATGS